MSDIFVPSEIYSIENFLTLCKNKVSEVIPSCWLQAEVSNLKKMPSGHWYFTLKDKNSQINAVFFRLQQYRLSFDIENGLEVLARVSPTIYVPRGSFQVIIEEIEPAGIGSLQLSFEQLKSKLAKKGWFDADKKKSLVKYPKKIAIVTSNKGAVISDITKIITKRYRLVQIVVCDSIVQGEYAPVQIANALQIADRQKADVIIVARGGGSMEDLWAFNSELVAQAIFSANTPVISAIGHESDFTIADFVADIRASTPSVAANMVVPDSNQVLQDLDMFIDQSRQHILYLLSNFNDNLNDLSNKLIHPQKILDRFLLKLNELKSLLDFTMAERIAHMSNDLDKNYYSIMSNSPKKLLENKIQLNNVLLDQLTQSMQYKISLNNTKLKNNFAQISQLNPKNILSRGYNLSFKDTKLVKTIKDLSLGDEIKVIYKDGQVFSKIINIEQNDT